MSMDEIIELVRSLPGSLVVTPGPGDGTPELAWGDAFFYHAPDGVMPTNEQPYATVVTKDYPDDTASRLGNGRWRVNIHVGRATFVELTGENPRDLGSHWDHAAEDMLMPHPVYGALGWLAVIDPGPATSATLERLLRDAHHAARARHERREARASG
ncbi:hypothetical protein CLV46_2398 [Diaminobutyricimonas aerilata]|uniref:DUF6194 domain-containing protein n=1 Tax=Diaminobutyricimonas aerilata TaxID=1162967 RepID=A0A2M9CLQ5_9MICO|nr:DUF6194 family protein [Diaminobutyricimonas aerilata]PJJ72821.1 hypothetical protein CLV46_2398 [Diaminobutyricimonas aerilata]